MSANVADSVVPLPYDANEFTSLYTSVANTFPVDSV